MHASQSGLVDPIISHPNCVPTSLHPPMKRPSQRSLYRSNAAEMMVIASTIPFS